MAVYFIDVLNGKDNNDGLSEKSPISNYKSLDIQPGDSVLFKRGSFIREKLKVVGGEEGKSVTYGAYGDGEMPTFCGSVNVSDKSLWAEESKNLWFFNADGLNGAANFVFNKSDLCGTLRWTKAELCEQGDFFDNCFGCQEKSSTTVNHRIYLYSKKNPAELYSDIECVIHGDRVLADNGRNIIFKNLRFINSGVHAIAGAGKTRNMKVLDCSFEHIGGAVWSYEQKIRFGNGVELWDICENVEVSGCFFYDIYDSAVTHQGAEECELADNFIIRDNVFIKCGMAAYEQRDMLPLFAQFNNNICINAGEGFSMLGEIMPRYSEIWPQPMGHHIFLWRIDNAEKGRLEIKNNLFYNSKYGAAVYSIICDDAEQLTELEGNIYYSENKNLISRWHGKDFSDFEEYRKYDKNSVYQKEDIAKVLREWSKRHFKICENRI